MTIYAITNAERYPKPIVIAYRDRTDAEAGIEALHNDVSAHLVEDERQLDQEYPTKDLLTLYNSLAERPVERFSDRQNGLDRTFRLVVRVADKLGESSPESTEMPEEPTESVYEDTGLEEFGKQLNRITSALNLQPAVTEVRPRPSSKKRGRTSSFSRSQVIRLLKVENPKRIGSAAYARYRLYRDGMTVGEFLDEGGTTADLRWDSDENRNFIAIE